MEPIGDRLKVLRKSKKLTLRQVAERTNLSISFISQVENGKSSITIDSLVKIAEALDVDPSFFFSDGKNKLRSNKKVMINKHDSLEERSVVANFTYQDLSGDFPDQSFLPTLVTLEPRHEGVRPLSHSGQEFIYVLQGILTIIFDDGEVSLEAGESIHMDSTIPHNWLTKTDKPVTFLYVSAR